MELLLIRHARPLRAHGGSGPADPALSPLGLPGAEALADWLAAEKIDAVYSSPLRRAQETAAPLAARLGLPVALSEAVSEYDADAVEYIPMEELKAAGDPRWNEVPQMLPEFQQRVIDGIEAIVGAHPSGRIAVVCHGGVVNVYTAWVVGVRSGMFFLPHYTSISRVLASSSGGNRSVDTLNETPHLRLADVPLTELG
jgi:2,3-bisphosphoglycerate-dependent phosphoglycerate mutase